jgi:hypothetical protein
MLVQHEADRPALFRDAPLLQEREEHVFLLGVVALVGKLLEEPGYPLRKALGDGLPRFEAGHGLFQQGKSPLDQFVLGHQAFHRTHDAGSGGRGVSSMIPEGILFRLARTRHPPQTPPGHEAVGGQGGLPPATPDVSGTSMDLGRDENVMSRGKSGNLPRRFTRRLCRSGRFRDENAHPPDRFGGGPHGIPRP